MALQQYELWGIDALLEGYENRLLLVLPVISCHGRLGVARDTPWAAEPEHSFKWIASEGDYRQAATTELTSDTPLSISSGQLVLLMGGKFSHALKVLSLNDTTQFNWTSIQEDFKACCIELGEGLALLKYLAQQARDAFDREFEEVSLFNRSLSPKAEAALMLLNGNDQVPLDWRFVRKLAAARLIRNPDAYRRARLAAEIRLKLDGDQIERLVDEYVRTVSGTWASHNPWPATDPAVCGNWFRTSLLRGLPFSDEGSRRRWATGMGSSLGGYVASGELTEDWFTQMWETFSEPLSGKLNGSDRLVYPEIIRSYVQQLSLRWQLPESKWSQHSGQRRDLQKFLKTINKNSKEPIILGVDQFPETRLLEIILSQACRDVGIAPFTAYPLKYGTNTLSQPPRETATADVSVRNRLTVIDTGTTEPIAPIFLHGGYYAFSQDSYLRSLIQESHKGLIPEEVRNVSERLLDKDETDWPETINARCWIAFHGGLRRPPNGEFANILDAIERAARIIGIDEAQSGWRPSMPNEFDASFEAFVREDTLTFMGGTVHSRLTMRWLRQPLDIITILKPEDFRNILPEGLFPVANILAFSERLKNSRKSSLRTAIRNAYREAWKLLDQLANGPEDQNSSDFLRDLMCRLVSPDVAAAEWDARWSIITNTADMRDLLALDNRPVKGREPSANPKRKKPKEVLRFAAKGRTA